MGNHRNPTDWWFGLVVEFEPPAFEGKSCLPPLLQRVDGQPPQPDRLVVWIGFKRFQPPAFDCQWGLSPLEGKWETTATRQIWFGWFGFRSSTPGDCRG